MQTRKISLLFLIMIGLLTIKAQKCGKNQTGLANKLTSVDDGVRLTKRSVDANLANQNSLANQNNIDRLNEIVDYHQRPSYEGFIEKENANMRAAILKYNVDDIGKLTIHSCYYDGLHGVAYSKYYSKEALLDHLCEENTHAVYSQNSMRPTYKNRRGQLKLFGNGWPVYIFENKSECLTYIKEFNDSLLMSLDERVEDSRQFN